MSDPLDGLGADDTTQQGVQQDYLESQPGPPLQPEPEPESESDLGSDSDSDSDSDLDSSDSDDGNEEGESLCHIFQRGVLTGCPDPLSNIATTPEQLREKIQQM